MASFHCYSGAYDHEGQPYRWQCFATARVYDVRLADHAKVLPLVRGRRWVRLADSRGVGLDLLWLVDEGSLPFSAILAQVSPPATRDGWGEVKLSA